MSADILPFTGEYIGERPMKRTAHQRRVENRAVHDARLITDAKGANDDWTARLLLAMLQRLPSKQLDLLEFDLIGPRGIETASQLQALAIVQLVKGSNAHRERVKSHLAAFARRGGQ